MQITPRGLVTNGIKDTKHYWYLLIAILLLATLFLTTAWNYSKSESKNPYDQWGLGQEKTAEKELKVIEELNSDNKAIQTQWPMAPPKIEVMSDWGNSITYELYRTYIRYIKIDGRLAIQTINLLDNASRIIFVPEDQPEKTDETKNPAL